MKAPVDTAIDFALKTPGFGTGLYDREGGLKVGQKKTYDVTITRTTGPTVPSGTSCTWRTTGAHVQDRRQRRGRPCR